MAAAALSVACADEPRAAPFQLADSAGVPIARSDVPADPVERGIGAAELVIGDNRAPLADVIGAVRLSDGRIVVADGGSAAIAFFAVDGTPLGSVGRPGDGPSEFRIMESIGRLAGDSVWVYDFSLSRLTVVSPTLEVARTVSLSPPVGPARAVGVLPAGGLVVGEAWSSAGVADADRGGLRRDPVAYLRYSDLGELVDTVVVVPGREVVLSVEDGRTVMGSAPFGRNTAHALVGSEILLGTQVEHEVRGWSPTGELLRIVRWRGGDLRLTREERDTWMEARLAEVEPEQRPEARRRLADVALPEATPAYREILPAPVGRFWVGAYLSGDGEAVRWWAFDARGAWIGTLSMPRGFRPLDFGPDWVLGVSTDSLDVQRVELRPFEPFGPAR